MRSQNAGITVCGRTASTSAMTSEQPRVHVPAQELRAAAFDQAVGGRVGRAVAGEHDGRLRLVRPAFEQLFGGAGGAVGGPRQHDAARFLDWLCGDGDRPDVVAGVGAQRRFIGADEVPQRLRHGGVDKNIGASVAQNLQCEFRAAAVGRHRQQERPAFGEWCQRLPAIA